MRRLLWVLGLVLVVSASDAAAAVRVRGYYRKNGTYVQPHYRSNPDGIKSNNCSARGNVNPYTGQVGTRAVGVAPAPLPSSPVLTFGSSTSVPQLAALPIASDAEISLDEVCALAEDALDHGAQQAVFLYVGQLLQSKRYAKEQRLHIIRGMAAYMLDSIRTAIFHFETARELEDNVPPFCLCPYRPPALN